MHPISAARIVKGWSALLWAAFAPSVTATEIDPGPTVSGSQGIERLAEWVLRLYRSVYVVFFIVSLHQQRPSRRHDDQPPADLHHWQRNPKKGQDVGPHKIRPNQQEETVPSDSPRQFLSRFRAVLASHRQNERAAPKRVHDGEKRRQHKK